MRYLLKTVGSLLKTVYRFFEGVGHK